MGRWSALLEVGAVALITAVAGFLRFSALDAAPPGFYHDESIYGVLAAYVYHGNREIYFGEREGLYMYILAAGMRLLGHDILTLRMVTAMLGTATIPALYLLARLLFGRRVALLAAAGLAASYWHVSLSRTVFRAMTLPLFETVALALLWAALRARPLLLRASLFAVAGAALGLALYTYIAARMLPVVVAAFLVGETLRARRPVRPAWLTLPLYAAGAGMVFWPLAMFMLEHPSSFLGRMSEVAVTGAKSGPALYFENLFRVAGMFFVAGDTNWRHNLAGRPVFDPVFAAAFILGLTVTLRGWRRAEYRFLLLWFAAMLVPTIAAVDAPHFLRADGVLPAIHILAALGFARAFAWVAPRLRILEPGRNRAAFGALAGLLLVVSAGVTWHVYFNVWLPRAETYYAFDGPHSSAADYMATSSVWQASAGGKDDFFVSKRFWQDRTAMMYRLWPWISGRDRDDMGHTRLGSRWPDEERALPLRVEGGVYLLAAENSWAAQELERQYGAADLFVERGSTYIAGITPFVALTAPAQLSSYIPPPRAVFGESLGFVSYHLPATVPSGGELEVVTRWRVQAVPGTWRQAPREPSIFVHLLDADGSLLAAADGLGFDVADWRAGEDFLVRHTLNLPTGVIPGDYSVVVGLVDPDGNRTTVAGGQQGAFPLPSRVSVEPRRDPPPPVVQHPATFALESQLALLGANTSPQGEVAQGQSLKVELFWRALSGTRDELSLQVALLGENGALAGRSLSLPVGGTYPATRWQAGEIVRQVAEIPVSARAPAGRYSMSVELTGATGTTLGDAKLGLFDVRALPRTYAAPNDARPVSGATFANAAALAGYEIEPHPVRPGGVLAVKLYWRSLRETDERFKVFVHLVGQDGLVAQSDAEPAANTRPLSSWVENEVIADEHQIELPADLAAGEYALNVGFYGLHDGKRLPVVDDSGATTGDHVELKAVTVAP